MIFPEYSRYITLHYFVPFADKIVKLKTLQDRQDVSVLRVLWNPYFQVFKKQNLNILKVYFTLPTKARLLLNFATLLFCIKGNFIQFNQFSLFI